LILNNLFHGENVLSSSLKGVSFFKWSTIKGISTFFILLVICTPNAHNNQRSSVTRKILENRISTSSSFAHNRSWVNASPGSVGKFTFFLFGLDSCFFLYL